MLYSSDVVTIAVSSTNWNQCLYNNNICSSLTLEQLYSVLHNNNNNIRSLEDLDERKIWLVDLACPVEPDIEEKLVGKKTKYQQLAF